MVEITIDFSLKDRMILYKDFDVWLDNVCKKHKIEMKIEKEVCYMSGFQRDLINLFKDMIIFENKTYEGVLCSF